MAHDDDFRFIPIEAFADMSSYQGAAGRDKLAREARFVRQLNDRTIAERWLVEKFIPQSTSSITPKTSHSGARILRGQATVRRRPHGRAA
jgi:hypothetical protein